MKKLLLLLLLSTNVFSQGDPAPYIKGQSSSGLGNIGSTIQVPKNQSTKLNSYQARIETGNTNELRNPSFEGSPYNLGWTCPTGTISQAVGPDGFKALGIVSSGAGFECNQTFTSTADLKGTLARFFARVKTSAPNTFVCGLDGGSLAGNRVNCQKVSLTSADKVFSETSGFFNYGNMVYGIAIYSTDTAAFPTVIDDVSMGAAGLTTATIQSDTTYSAQVSPAGVISQDVKPGWVTACTVGSGIYSCPIVGFTQKLNCSASATGTTRIIHYNVNSSTASMIVFTEVNPPSTAINDVGLSIVCQKTGADYANSSTSAILSSNANYSRRLYTPTFTGFGTVTNVECYESRVGEYNEIDCKWTNGTTTGVEGRISLPGANVAQTFTQGIRLAGGVMANAYSASSRYGLYPLIESGASYITFGSQDTATNALTKAVGTQTLAGAAMAFTARIPIAGWTQSPIAIIPLAETVKIPGTSQNDRLKFRFGAAGNVGNICTGGTCGLQTPPGSTMINNVAFSSLGTYGITLNRTYSYVVCDGIGFAAGVSATVAPPVSCSGCSALNISFTNAGTGALQNSNGSIDCQGTY